MLLLNPVSIPSLKRSQVLLLAALGAWLGAPSAAPAASPGIDEGAMNKAVAPGDDFWEFANGTWLAKTEIPADKSRWGAGGILAEQTNLRLIALIEAAAKNRASASAPAQMVADYFTAFMDEAGIEAKGLKPIQPMLQQIGAIADKTALARALGGAIRADVDALNSTNFYTENLFGLWVVQGFSDTKHYTPYLLQGGLGLPDRAYYVTQDERMEGIRKKYQAYIATILKLAGIAEPEARAARIFALERQIAEAHATREDSEDVLKANNPWRRADFDQKAPGLDWAAFFGAAGLEGQGTFTVWQPSAVIGESALVAGAPLADWKDWLVFHTLNHFAGVLPKAFGEASFAFFGTALAGTPQQQARPKRALESANAVIGDLVGQVYVAKYFPPASKAKLQAMVANLLHAFDERITKLDWMAPSTKEQARAKLKTLYIGIGYPDHWKDYTGLVLDPADAVGNLRRAEELDYRKNVAKLGSAVDPTEWCMVAQIVNAVNMPLQNALDFPAGILQPPFFDPSASDAANYGGIGATIGHEISHSFDDQGCQFDAQGRLRDWWTPDDLAHFKASSAALATQYSAYHPFPDLAVNGQLNLSENIADLAGLSAALNAFHAATAGKARAAGPAYSDDQLFFIAFAQSWSTKTREEALRKQILTDGHSPAQYRALTVRNLDAWYAAFGVKPAEKLYLEPAARVRVW